MDYAIIDFKGHQYQIKPGQELTIDRLDLEENEELEINNVLLTKSGEDVAIGQPKLKTKVSAKVVKHFKGDKITVRKFKAKKKYRRKKGFRPQLTKIKITDIKTE